MFWWVRMSVIDRWSTMSVLQMRSVKIFFYLAISSSLPRESNEAGGFLEAPSSWELNMLPICGSSRDLNIKVKLFIIKVCPREPEKLKIFCWSLCEKDHSRFGATYCEKRSLNQHCAADRLGSYMLFVQVHLLLGASFRAETCGPGY